MVKKIMNREVMAYLAAGVMTTLVNIGVYHISCNVLGVESLVANAAAWILSVLFAFVVNDKFVFIQEKTSPREEGIKVVKFFGARVFSFLVDEAGMFLLVDLLTFHNMLAKLGMNVIVVVLNYLFSKVYIFKTREEMPHGN